MKKYSMIFLYSFLLFNLAGADYPTTEELWKSFVKTSGSRVHVNRVFVKPDTPLHKEKKLKWKNANIQKTNARFNARRKVRNEALNRIYSNFVPGEKAFMLVEKYDLFHERTYTVYVLTQQNMYFFEINEVPEKGTVAAKYPLEPLEIARLTEAAKQIKASDGSCDMIDSRNYPTFISVKRETGKWESVICSAVSYTWANPNDKQKDFFQSVTGFMKIVSELAYICNTKQVPPIVIKTK